MMQVLPEIEKKIAERIKDVEEHIGKPILTESVGPEQIADIVARWTGVPVSKLSQSDR